MTSLAKVCNVPMPPQEPREYRHTGEVTHCCYGFCDRVIDLNLFPKPNGEYIKGLGWVCNSCALKFLEGEE